MLFIIIIYSLYILGHTLGVHLSDSDFVKDVLDKSTAIKVRYYIKRSLIFIMTFVIFFIFIPIFKGMDSYEKS